MKYIIEKKNALKIFYYFMAIDGEITIDEKCKFEEIAQELEGETYLSYKTEMLDECEAYISSVANDEELYDAIVEAVDRIINSQKEEYSEGLSRRLLIWNLYALSFSDEKLTSEEKRFISHVGRILGVEKSVLLEMEQLIKTEIAVMNELDVLKESMRPYTEIKPLVEEIEHRNRVLMKVAQNLIGDDYFEAIVQKEKSKAILKNAKELIGEKTSKGVLGLKAGTEKFAKKIKKS